MVLLTLFCFLSRRKSAPNRQPKEEAEATLDRRRLVGKRGDEIIFISTPSPFREMAVVKATFNVVMLPNENDLWWMSIRNETINVETF